MARDDEGIKIGMIEAEDMPGILPLVRQLNPAIPTEVLRQRLSRMIALGYRCVGAHRERVLIAIAGLWFGTRFYCGDYVDIDNVVVDEKYRSRGIGTLLMDWIEAYAKKRGCQVSVLDAYTTNTAAREFYLRDGYRIIGFHFFKELS